MKKKALIVCGGWPGHEPFVIGERFKSMLQKEGFEVEISDTLDVYADKDKLMSLNLIVPMWTQGTLDDEYQFNISDVLESGVGMAGCHGGMCDSFRWNTGYQFMTGAQWVAHPGVKWYNNVSVLDEELMKKHFVPQGAFDIEYTVNIRKSSSSPIIEGIEDFTVKTEQYYLHIDPAVDVLATTLIKDSAGPHASNGVVVMPVIYTKKWGRGKIFYSSLGHTDRIFEIPQVSELMRRGFVWAAK